jgi:hypothetical protein
MKQAALIVSVLLVLNTIPIAAAQTITAVTNGGRFVADEIAPGSLATIFGADLAAGRRGL